MSDQELTKKERLAVLVSEGLLSAELAEAFEAKLSTSEIILFVEEQQNLADSLSTQEVKELTKEEQQELYESLRQKLGLEDSDLKKKYDEKVVECRQLKQSKVDTGAIKKYASEILKIVK